MAATAKQEMLDFKSRAVLKQQLLGDPLHVSAQDFDPEYVDNSPRHREEMRRKLYGLTRLQYDRKASQEMIFL